VCGTANELTTRAVERRVIVMVKRIAVILVSGSDRPAGTVFDEPFYTDNSRCATRPNKKSGVLLSPVGKAHGARANLCAYMTHSKYIHTVPGKDVYPKRERGFGIQFWLPMTLD
jgi:hypothetical protein